MEVGLERIEPSKPSIHRLDPFHFSGGKNLVLLRAITNFRVDQSIPHPPAQALQDEWKKAVGRIPPEMSNLFLGGVKPLGDLNGRD